MKPLLVIIRQKRWWQLRNDFETILSKLRPDFRSAKSDNRAIDLTGKAVILETLKHCLGNRTHAANILGISIRTLRNKLNEYAADGVPVPPPNGGEMRGAA